MDSMEGKKEMIYLELFWSFIQIGLFSIGGGYAAMPLIQNQVVELHHWMTLEEFTDIITISQMTPGPIAINSATFVGLQIGGIGGAVAATIGCVLPSVLIMLLFAFLYGKYEHLTALQGILNGLRPAVIALIGTAGITIGKLAFWKDGRIDFLHVDWIGVAIFLCCLYFLRKWKVSQVKMMLLAGGIGGLIYLWIG